MISSWFLSDLSIDRKDAQATHIIQAIGSSSIEKGKKFVEAHIPNMNPTVYGSYEEAYQDPNVDVIYIGTPHGFHKKNCLDAIAHGKNIMCEKAFTLNAREAREVLEAAKAKGVYVMEAMWTRHFPLVKMVQKTVPTMTILPRCCHPRILFSIARKLGIDRSALMSIDCIPSVQVKDLSRPMSSCPNA